MYALNNLCSGTATIGRFCSARRKAEITISSTNNSSGASPRRTPSDSAASRSAAQRSGSQRPRSAAPNGQRPTGQRSGQRPSGQHSGSKKRRKKKKSSLAPLLVVLVLLLVLAVGVFVGLTVEYSKYVNYDKILPNVYVAGIDVGGMTVDEAKAAIEGAITETEQKSINVHLPDQTLTFTPAQDTVLIDVDQAVAEAYNYGRSNTKPSAMKKAIRAAQNRRNDIDITSAVTVDNEYIRKLVDDTAAEVSADLVETVVDTDTEARVITVTIGTPGKSLDADSLYNLVSSGFANGDYSDIDFEYNMTYPANVALDRLYEQLTTEPKDAVYNSDTGEVDAEVCGYTPTTELVQANEQLATAAAGDVLTFTFDEVQPEITAEELESVLFRDTLYSYGTVYASNAGRTTNLRLACAAINGTVLQPGEVFSFNDVVGERTAEKGYQEATVYVSGDSVPALGGGICQVASTIYYCCLYSDLEIVHREEHMYYVTYVPGGLDATVYWGSVDFQFRNSTDYPLRVDAYLANGRVYVELVGTDVNNYTIKIDSQRVSTTPFNKVTKEGVGENQSGYTGYVYEITRYVYDSNGNLVRTDTTADLDNMGGLGTSTYQKRDQVTYTGSSSGSYDPSPSPSTEPSTAPSTQPSTQPSTDPTAPPSTDPTAPPTTVPTVPPTVAPIPDPVPVPDPE